jgi:hypothetical protein
MSSEVTIFKPSRTKLIFLLYSAMIVSILLVFWGGLIFNIAGVCLSFLAAYIAFISKRTIAVSSSEIAQVFYDKSKTLRWNEIVRISNSHLWLTIYDFAETDPIIIHILLAKYSELREFIAQKRPDLMS